LLGLGIILIGAVIFTSVSGTGDIAIVGLAALIIGLILLIVGIVRVSTKSKSQVRKEAELLAHSKYQAAIISAQNGESPTSDEIIENLEKLSLLKKQGILSKQEFEREKKKIIG
jgi:tetrahydromethanopterin S-methyltransferase subunit H